MKDIKAIIDELADLRDIDIQSLDDLGKCILNIYHDNTTTHFYGFQFEFQRIV